MDVDIIVNGEAWKVAAGGTLVDLLGQQGRDPRTVAVEKNGAIVPRRDYGAVLLEPGDRIEIVHFVQGG